MKSSEVFEQLLHAAQRNDVQEHERLVALLVKLCVSEPLHVLRDVFRVTEIKGSNPDSNFGEMYLAREFGHVVRN